MSDEKPYKVISGSQQALSSFESEVAAAIEMGYSLAGDLIVKTAGSEIKFFQPLVLESAFLDEDEDEDDEDEDEE